MKLRAALYLRGRPNDETYRAQADAHELLQQRGWQLVDTFVDGLNVASNRRRALHTMLDVVRERRLDVVVVSSLDRLVASLHELVVLFELLRSYGCGLVSARQPMLDTTGPASELLGELLGEFAGFARDVKVGRSRLGLEVARRRGTRIGRPRVKSSLTRARHAREGRLLLHDRDGHGYEQDRRLSRASFRNRPVVSPAVHRARRRTWRPSDSRAALLTGVQRCAGRQT